MRALLVACVLLAPALVSAQDEPVACEEGRTRGAEGFCCWPGQTFSTTARRCEGAPRCPEGLVEHGESCLGTVVPPPPSYEHFDAPPPMSSSDIAAPPPTGRTTSGWPARHDGHALGRAVRRHGEDGGLVAMSMVVFDIGWVFGMLVGMLDEATGSCRTSFFSGSVTSCNSWPLVFIPVGGGLTAGLTNFGSGTRNTSAWGLTFGIISVLMQCIGLIMMAVSLANEVHDLGTVPLGDGVALSWVPAAQSSDVGLSGVLTF